MSQSNTIDQPVLWHVAICVLPAMAFVRLGSYGAAAYTLFGLFALLFSYALVQGNPHKATALVLGCLPGMMLLRDYFYYSSVEVLLAAAVLAWQILDRTELVRAFQDRLIKWLIWFAIVYWALSYLITRDYSANLRIFELVFSAVGFRLLARRRGYGATALWGIAITGFAIGAALSGQGERLGMVRNSDARLGNPITFGVPMALIFLLSIADSGRRLMLERRPLLRAAVNLSSAVFLILSTSRGSWAVVAVCVLLMLLVSRARVRVAQALALGFVGLSIWVRYADTSVVDKYIQKTFSSQEEWSFEYNARVAQWETFPIAFGDSPIWGFGPGRGKQVSLRYSGHSLIWHSLYLHLGIECGLIGLIPLACLLIVLIRRGLRYNRLRGEVAPLIGIVGFTVVATSVPAIDGVSGLFLGLGLTGSELGEVLYTVRTVLLPLATEQPVPGHS